jgi:anti-sigma B factor antagonist
MSENHTRSTRNHRERVVGGTTVVELRDEIDIATAPPVSARLDVLTAVPHPDLVLDLRAVSFIDCSGLRVLCRARGRVLARHGRLRLVTDSPTFLRILRRTGLGGVFDVHSRFPEVTARRPSPAAPRGAR